MFKEIEARMSNVLVNLKSELATIRTGRASTALLDKIYVDYYGSPTPINQVASISIPEPRMILIQPWDLKMIEVIEKTIIKADIGLNPSNDGKVIRLILPELTAERRHELVRLAKKKTEEAKIPIRNIRREYNDILKEMERNGEISEDNSKRSQEKIQKITDKFIGETDIIMTNKERDIMEV